MCLRPALNWRL